MIISAVASASPSIRPMKMTLAPSVVTINSGNKLWMISEEMSINMLTPPTIQTPLGIWLSVENREAMLRSCYRENRHLTRKSSRRECESIS